MANVRCPLCGKSIRVPAYARGVELPCPHCGEPFLALPDDVPMVYAAEVAPRPMALLVGLALAPFGIPLVWLLAALGGAPDPIFTLALPVALAAAASGLALGVAFTADWSTGARVRGIFALVLLGYGTATFLYFVQKDWLEAARKNFGRDPRAWQDYSPPDRAYTIRMPGRPQPAPNAVPLPGWSLQAVRCLEPSQTSDAFLVAHGPQPDDFAPLDDATWFARAKEAIAQSAGGGDVAEKELRHQNFPGREFLVVMPDKVTNRTVRLIRAKSYAYYLAIDGPALPSDARDVRKFFDLFVIRR